MDHFEFPTSFSRDIFRNKYAHGANETWPIRARRIVNAVCGDDGGRKELQLLTLNLCLEEGISTMQDESLTSTIIASASELKRIQEKLGEMYVNEQAIASCLAEVLALTTASSDHQEDFSIGREEYLLALSRLCRASMKLDVTLCKAVQDAQQFTRLSTGNTKT